MDTPSPSPSPEMIDAVQEAAVFHADVLARMDLALGALVFVVLVMGVLVVKALW